VQENEIVRWLEPRLASGGRLLAVYLFGSEAEGRARPDSDVDLAFLSERALDPVVVFDVAQDLATALHRDVDLVDLSRASTVLRAQVIGRGRVLHSGDARRVGEFEMYALSDYARLNEERARVMESFLERYRVG
jgi:predicted nucleotidyltransferase